MPGMRNIDRNGLLDEILARSADGKRLMIAIAGAPAAGKSTLAEYLCHKINAQSGAEQPAIVVPMDGFHYDNLILDARGDRARKGAPHTFDIDGFAALLVRLQSNTHDVAIPLFDRALDMARAGAALVTRQHGIVLVEGNYLLLNQPSWRDLRSFFDLSIFLDVPLPVLEQRLIQRWVDHGAELSAAKARALTNDIPNAQFVIQHTQEAEFILRD